MTMMIAQGADVPTLRYAATKNRWERGVMWLTGIVCIVQLMGIPEAIILWIRFLLANGVTALAPPAFGLTIVYVNYFLLVVCRMALLPLCQLAIVGLSLRVLARKDGARRGLFLACLAAALLEMQWGFAPAAWASYSEDQHRRFWTPYTGGIGENWQTWSFIYRDKAWGYLLGEIVVNCYPLVLLACVIRRQDEAMRRQMGATGLWIITIAACVLMALPTSIEWITSFPNRYLITTSMVFAIYLDRGVSGSVFGIGIAAGAGACLSIFFAIVYTLFKGPKGRASLMICAALLTVFAAAVPGQAFLTAAFEFARGIMSGRLPLNMFLGPCFSVAMDLTTFAAALAFPLALRMALSLSDVRDKLDGMRQPSQEPGAAPAVPANAAAIVRV
jgi:hypothetical protein